MSGPQRGLVHHLLQCVLVQTGVTPITRFFGAIKYVMYVLIEFGFVTRSRLVFWDFPQRELSTVANRRSRKREVFLRRGLGILNVTGMWRQLSDRLCWCSSDKAWIQTALLDRDHVPLC